MAGERASAGFATAMILSPEAAITWTRGENFSRLVSVASSISFTSSSSNASAL